jgi:hypothetical protein
VKVLTEGLAHSLRNIDGCQVTAHLLIPGHVWTGITGRKPDQPASDKPKGAWTPEQTVDFMLERLGGRRRHHPESPGPVALAQGLEGQVRRLRQGRYAVKRPLT